ncbi:uncharacterized protein LOC135486831 [Lineus longissimus]|uniref:uncharacterized protein LOC135486831 n=1 Tax=Lineus longissimus TaxID=88925 RepID=UPI00315D72B2
MPRSEEWSQKAWKWQKEILQNLKWSDERGVFYTLEELMAFGMEWPKMIMPKEGWLGDGESASFSAGQALVGLGVRNFKRIAACPWEDCFNTSIAEIVKKATPRYIIPLTTMGELRHASRVKILRIQSEEQVYTTMEDLWKFHPRYAMPDKTFTAGNEIVKSGETIELRSPENGCITCYLKAIDKTVPVPMTQRGDFTIVEDGTSYTLQQVYDNFNLPQRVSFERYSAGMYGTDVLLISETRYDVLIACVTAGLYVEDKEEERTEPWGTRDEDFADVSFIFLPRPISEESPLADTKFLTWLYDPNDPTCQVIMSRASVFELDRFKDMNVAINANSASIPAVMEYSSIKIYDYIKVHDFTGDNSVSPPRGSSTAAPAVSVGSPSTSWLHSGGATKVTDPFSEEPNRRPKPEPLYKMFKHGLQKIKSPVLTLKRNKGVSDASSDKPEEPQEVFHNIPRVDYSNIKTQDRRPRKGSLPLLLNDGSDRSEDDGVQATYRKIRAENKSMERGRLPLPGEVKKRDQQTVQPFPLSKLPPENMYDQKTRKKEKDVIAKLGPFSEETAIKPKPESSYKMFKHRLQKIKSPLPKLKRNKGVSSASSDKPEEPEEVFHNIPRVDYSNMKTQARRPRKGSLPLLLNDGSDRSEDDGVQATYRKIRVENKSMERGRLPLPGEVKKRDQQTVQPFPLSKLPPENMYDQKTRKKEKDVIAKHGPRPSLPPKPVRVHNAVQGQRSVVQGQVAVIKGQIAVGQGQSVKANQLRP